MSFPFDRHVPFYLALAASTASAALAIWLPAMQATVIAANAFFATYLALTLAGLPHLTVDYLKMHAASADEPVWIIFLVTFAAVVVALVSLFILVNARNEPGAFDLVFALSAVPLGWLTIHMMAAVHYAHVYWQPEEPKEGRNAQRGLDFPETNDPRGIDFVYFAFVIGMTAQTSDVAITTHRMRRINLVHAIASFFFNTVLVAAAVNVAVSLGN
jgi:uncharacterized membrane protein